MQYKSKITPIFIELAKKNGCKLLLMQNDSDAGYFIDKNGGRHYFAYGTIDLNSSAATEFANDKKLSSEVVLNAGIRCPKEVIISTDQSNDAENKLRTVGLPAIIKPAHGKQGKGIFKIDSRSGLDQILRSNDYGESDLILQEYIDMPSEIRVVMLDGDVIQAYRRDHAHVVGDGIKDIRELIEEKNLYFERRMRNTVIDVNDSQIVDILSKAQYKLGTVLPPNSRLNISYGRNLSRGGEYEFIEEEFSPVLESVCKKIYHASGLRFVGVDLFLDGDISSVTNESSVVFIEYNASPDMENNFYYDDGYDKKLREMYEIIFNKIIG